MELIQNKKNIFHFMEPIFISICFNIDKEFITNTKKLMNELYTEVYWKNDLMIIPAQNGVHFNRNGFIRLPPSPIASNHITILMLRMGFYVHNRFAIKKTA